jgi:hypothetical protein
VKYSLFLFLLTLPALAARADDAVKLNCPPRGAITVSFFNYYLITMKWGDHFQVASGKLQSHTKAGSRSGPPPLATATIWPISPTPTSTICFMRVRVILCNVRNRKATSIRSSPRHAMKTILSAAKKRATDTRQ